MPDPYSRFNLATIGESQGAGTVAAAFAAGAAGLAVAGAAGAATAGFGGVVGVDAGFSGAAFVSDGTDPEGIAFTPPGVAG